MGEYDRLIAVAKRLIAQKGQTVAWEERTPTGGTPGKPGGTTVVSNTVKMVFLPMEREYLATFLSTYKDTEVPTGLLMGLMAQVPFEPTLKGTVLRGSERYVVADENGIEKYDPNGEGAILYVIRLSR